MKAILAVEDGTVFEGKSIGAAGASVGEVVFSTAMTGYQEMLSDPSHAGQLLTLTYPLVGNYGVNPDDLESSGVQVAGFIVHNLCEAPSNWRSSGTLTDFLQANSVVALADVDTRAITRHIRVRGVMMGAVSTEHTKDELLDLIHSSAAYGDINFVEKVSTKERYDWPSGDASVTTRVAVLDCGVKRNVMRELTRMGCAVTVWPAAASAEDILSDDPDGIIISPGPGDPEKLQSVSSEIRKLSESKPLLGICLGHQLLARAYGGKTFKLKFGHRGGNHPVKDLETGRVYITSQNHGYAVDGASLEGSGLEVAYLNMNDQTVEGLRHSELPVFSVQYHPEASPGPVDNNYLFRRFLDLVHQHSGKIAAGGD